MQYNFAWKVSEKDAKPDGAFFQHTEKAEEANPDRVEGEFRTWLPDGRLKIVTYYVDKVFNKKDKKALNCRDSSCWTCFRDFVFPDFAPKSLKTNLKVLS